MADIKAPEQPEYLSLSCNCFKKNSDICPYTKIPKSNFDYIQREKRKAEATYNEIEKHQYFDFENENQKPCYGFSDTLALTLRYSLLRHKNSLKRLSGVLKKNERDYCYIKMVNGKLVPVENYSQAVKQMIETSINCLNNFTEPSSFVSVQKLKESEKNHIDTLKILENVIRPSENRFDQLEIPIQSSL